MNYTKQFDWQKLEQERPTRPDGGVRYLYDDALELAVNVALASGRPLLLSGEPGSGKSTLAADTAWKLGRRFYTSVVTSRTQAQDLQWSFDAVGRLALASGGKELGNSKQFVQPGVLWRAFAPKTAAKHGKPPAERAWGDEGKHAVVLIDEIDKADPDVPNDLLVVIEQRQFRVFETNTEVEAPHDLETLVVLSTNGERDLPPAFLRRCVMHHIDFPKNLPERTQRMRDIVRRHFPDENKLAKDLLDALIGLFAKVRDGATLRKLREPSTAELIDAARACQGLGIQSTQNPTWEKIATAAMWKHPTKPSLPDPPASSKVPVA